MRVLHLGSELSWRGGEQQQFYLINELQNKVTNLVGCRPGSKMEKKALQNGLQCFQLGFRGLQIATARIISGICETEKVDLIHCHTSRAHGAAFISAYMFGNKTPIIVSKRTDFPVKKSYLGRLKYNHPNIKKILCVSHKIKQIVQASIDFPEKAITIYSGVDPSRFDCPLDQQFKKNFNLSDEDILVGNTSAIAEHKDFYTFLDVAKIVTDKNPKIKFLIIGKGPLENEIKAYAQSLGIQEKVIFTGFINNIPEVLPQLDIFFMPSKEEGLGTSLLDAMCAKVPIVSTQAGGIPEIVIDGKTGSCGKVRDAKDLSNRILDLLSSKNLQKKFIDNAYKMVTEKFTKQVTAEKTYAIYQEVLGIKP